MLLTDLIVGRQNRWTELYEPSRKSGAAVKDFLKENVSVAADYTALLTPGEVDSTEEIENGEGAIVRRGISKDAIYRDSEGVIHSVSAVCRHLGCIVAWNPSEKTWDCPCHGSRYDRFGAVIEGPANSDLPPVEE